jgi:galactokinase
VTTIRAHAPGRVNLIGEHTDYMGGLALPVAIDLGTTIVGRVTSDRVALRSADFDEPVDLPLTIADPAGVRPAWGRYVAGVIAVLGPSVGVDGEITTTIPIGTGLSSSAALELAVALALRPTDRGLDAGPYSSPLALARACQRAEQLASGVPCGLMDQLTSAAGVEGHALLIDFADDSVEPVPVPDDVELVVVPSGQRRELATSAYATRRAELEAAEAEIGPLRRATEADLAGVTDRAARARARHVVTENERVRLVAAAFRADDAATAGRIMTQAHASFRDDFAASTPVVDDLVDRLVATPGVHGARLTGGGFGGCVIAVTEPGVLHQGWVVRASTGARVELLD